jgi:hypothetical protein
VKATSYETSVELFVVAFQCTGTVLVISLHYVHGRVHGHQHFTTRNVCKACIRRVYRNVDHNENMLDARGSSVMSTDKIVERFVIQRNGLRNRLRADQEIKDSGLA